MTTSELMLWSAACGAMALIVLAAVVDILASRTCASRQTLYYLASCSIWVVLLSGLPTALWPIYSNSFHVAQILVGPLCAALGCYGLHGWTNARQRDQLSSLILPGTTVLALIAGPLCLLLPLGWDLASSAALTMFFLLVGIWMTIRAALRGDRLAWGLTAANLIMLPGLSGMYSIALNGTRPALTWQVATAGCALFALFGTGLALWTRGQQIRRLQAHDSTLRDPTTRLYNGATMTQIIVTSQRRRRKTGSHGALMAAMVFDPGLLVAQVGHSGLQHIYTELALRLQRQTGVISPAGRCYDSCFLVLLETLRSPTCLRKIGLQVAASLRQPIEVESLTGERLIISADIGVGLIQVSPASKNVAQLLHDSLDAATAARRTVSRAVWLDPESRNPVALESAQLGDRWKRTKAKSSGPMSQS